MLVGYARVSSRDQSPALQLDALREAGCERTILEKASGAKRDRPELAAALDYIRAGDALVVWKLDRLWWTRFGPMFAAEIRRKRVHHMRAYTHWRWRLDEVYVKVGGEMRYLWRAVDHEGAP